MNFLIYTFGCKVNSYDSAAISQLLTRRGFCAASNEGEADILIVNSCTVTANSDRKARQLLRRLRRSWPQKTLVLCGCLPQASPDILGTVPDVDIVMGTGNRGDIAQVIEQHLSNRQTVSSILPIGNRSFEPLDADDIEGHTRAFLKIEEGCDRFCAYCIIPYARGGITSMSLEDIRNSAVRFSANGYREIVLTGINLSSYGRGDGLNLADAARVAASVDGIVRVRLGSLEPDLMTEELLGQLAAIDKLCPHFHLSLQSGCDATLQRMNRRYNTGRYLDSAQKIRSYFDNPSFTTDIIVGFPGETDTDFGQSLCFVRNFGFLKVHVFPYSERPGTAAANMPAAVAKSTRVARAAELSAACDAARTALLFRSIGQTVRVIAEQPSDRGYTGYTDRYYPALLRGREIAAGDVVCGTVVDVLDGCCVVDTDSR